MTQIAHPDNCSTRKKTARWVPALRATLPAYAYFLVLNFGSRWVPKIKDFDPSGR